MQVPGRLAIAQLSPQRSTAGTCTAAYKAAWTSEGDAAAMWHAHAICLILCVFNADVLCTAQSFILSYIRSFSH